MYVYAKKLNETFFSEFILKRKKSVRKCVCCIWNEWNLFLSYKGVFSPVPYFGRTTNNWIVWKHQKNKIRRFLACSKLSFLFLYFQHYLIYLLYIFILLFRLSLKCSHVFCIKEIKSTSLFQTYCCSYFFSHFKPLFFIKLLIYEMI